jgi:Protein of unknown function (DUF3300)
MIKKVVIVVSAILALVVLVRLVRPERHVARAGEQLQTQTAATPEALDRLLAPVALYPDQLLAQILICAQNPGNVDALQLWLGKNQSLKGSELQDALTKQGFEPSFVTLALFPQVVKMMADELDWTTNLGVAFTADRPAVFASIQRLRKQAHDVGTLKSTPQQEVETRTTSSGQEVIVIEPANPQIVYVPQYNTTTVYTQAPTSTTIVVESDNTDEVIAAGMIGFTAGIAMSAWSNPYYYGPYGWYGGAYMYNDAWDDYYDAREDAREDWADHREDIADERGDRVEDRGDRARDTQEQRTEQRTERQNNRQENRPESQAQRQERSTDAQAQRQQQRGTDTAASQRTGSRTPSAESRGYSQRQNQQAREPSARSSDAFGGYSNSRSTRSATQRGGASRSGGGRSRSGGGRRR